MLIAVRAKPATLAVGVMLSVATMMMPHQAAAQFVCGGSATGAEPQTGAGAVATGFISVSCGPSAGSSPNAGNSGNSSFGAFAGADVNGTENTAVGLLAGSVVTGDHNIAVGAFSGGAVTGSDNVAVGTSAGRSLQGSNNVAIGLGAGSGGLVPITASNTVAIGNSALASRR